MRWIHPDFKSKKILSFIKDLIVGKKYQNVVEIDKTERATLVTYIIDAAGYAAESECIVESPHFDQVMSLLKKAIVGKYEDDFRLAEAIKENAINYYDDLITDLFNYCLEEIDDPCNIDFGDDDEDRYYQSA